MRIIKNTAMGRKPLWFIVLSVTLASSVSLIGGATIEAVSEKILPVIPLIIAMPALNTMVGDYATIITSHFMGSDTKADIKKLRKSILTSVGINIASVLLLAIVLAAERGYVFHQSFVLKFSIFTTASVCVSVIVIFLLGQFLTRLLKNHNLNADDVLIPIITSVTDVLMLSMIALATLLIF